MKMSYVLFGALATYFALSSKLPKLYIGSPYISLCIKYGSIQKVKMYLITSKYI